MKHNTKSIYTQFPPSKTCACNICIEYCSRPGWWTVSEAKKAIEHGYANRMMLEFSHGFTFGVLSPAFKGNEGYFALQKYSENGCTFLLNDRCMLFDKSFRPLECRFCHHDRIGLGKDCHIEISKDWNTNKGKRLIKHWLIIRNLNMCDLFSFQGSV